MVTLVTGGTGFVGRALVARLLADGDRVRVLATAADPLRDVLLEEHPACPELEIVDGDIAAAADVDRAVAGCRRVFHVAAMVNSPASFDAFRAVNVGGTENVCRACVDHGVERLIAVATSDVFGIPGEDEVLDEDKPYRPWGEPYPDTKIEAANVVWDYHRRCGLATTLIYPGFVYGPGDRNLLPAVAEMIRDGAAVTWGAGDRFEVHLVYIDDLVAGILAAANEPLAVGNDFLILDDAAGLTVPQFYCAVAQELGVSVRVRRVPYAVVHAVAWCAQTLARRGWIAHAPLRTTDVKSFGYRFRYSSAKAREVLGWRPLMPTGEGIARSVAWFRDYERAGAPEE